MMQTIHTKNGDYHFEPVNLYHGRKKINKYISRENLLAVRNILLRSDIRWGLIFGTLLGAIRENDFIEHDEDTDIYILEEDREKLIGIIFEFREYGFDVARHEKSLLSIIRKNEYIDFYFFKKVLFGRRSAVYFVPKIHFSSEASVPLFQLDFPTVYKPIEYLDYTYGEDWRVPKVNSHAEKKPVLWVAVVKKAFPTFYNMYRKWREND
jgi:hypothetical protein